ncbi:neuronal PAS domain-containing protein 4 isoform X2 [Anas acuta]|uniref:neuronal PAS domain-containing protein 4 isoform X2 n=1 Tax=Anas acuta TaxID=28680 RepID=UPI0035C93B00
MTIFCSHCHRPLQAQASCLPSRAGAAPGVSKPFRSTKSASKARRDQINAELQALRSLLPISAREKERLSYLHTMALVCLRLRGAHLFPPVSAPPAGPVLAAELLSLLPGFLLVLSAAGKLVYISENVSQVLGLSMVELLAQGDTVFDILEGRAREEVCKKLLLAQEQPGRGKAGRTGGCWAGVLQELPCLGALWLPGRGAGPPREPLTQSCFAAEVTFVSEMRTSKAFRLQHGGNRAVAVRGHFMAPRWPAPPSATAFLALCTPVPPLAAEGDAGSQDELFHSTHALDMTFSDVSESVTYHLGYRREELVGRSWYSLLHPEDADLAAAQHRAVGEWPCPLPWSGYTQDQNGQDKAPLVLLTAQRRKQRVSDMPVRGSKHSGGLSKGWTSPLLTPPVAHSAGAGAGREPRGAAPAPPGPQLGLAPRLGTPGPRPHRLLQPQPQGGGGGLPAGQASRDRPGSASQPSAQPAGRTAPRLGRQPLAALLRRSCALPRCPRCSRWCPRGLPRRRPGSGPSPRRRAGGGAAGHCACAARASINGP